MASGLRVYNSAGAIAFDAGDRVSRALGAVQTGGSDGSITVSEFSLGTPYALVFPLVGAVVSGGIYYAPSLSIVGTTLSWTYTVTGMDCMIVYGVY